MREENNKIEEIVLFYKKYLNHYQRWAKIHCYSYWSLTISSILCGLILVLSMLLKFNVFAIAIIALILNAIFFLNQTIRSDKKYARYRIMEIKLNLAYQKFNNEMEKRILEGEDKFKALINNISDLHSTYEGLLIEEFSNHFKELKTFEELRNSMDKIKRDSV